MSVSNAFEQPFVKILPHLNIFPWNDTPSFKSSRYPFSRTDDHGDRLLLLLRDGDGEVDRHSRRAVVDDLRRPRVAPALDDLGLGRRGGGCGGRGGRGGRDGVDVVGAVDGDDDERGWRAGGLGRVRRADGGYEGGGADGLLDGLGEGGGRGRRRRRGNGLGGGLGGSGLLGGLGCGLDGGDLRWRLLDGLRGLLSRLRGLLSRLRWLLSGRRWCLNNRSGRLLNRGGSRKRL